MASVETFGKCVNSRPGGIAAPAFGLSPCAIVAAFRIGEGGGVPRPATSLSADDDEDEAVIWNTVAIQPSISSSKPLPAGDVSINILPDAQSKGSDTLSKHPNHDQHISRGG